MNRAARMVKQWREAQRPRLTQAEAARRFGLSKTHWCRIENEGFMPNLTVALELQRMGVCLCADWAEPVEGASEAAE